MCLGTVKLREAGPVSPDAGATELLAAGGTLDGAPGGGRAGAVQRTHHRHRDHVQVVSVLLSTS